MASLGPARYLAGRAGLARVADPAFWLVPSHRPRGLLLLTVFAHADLFWEAIPATRRSTTRATLDARLAEQLADAEGRWPDVRVDPRRFVTHWAAQLCR